MEAEKTGLEALLLEKGNLHDCKISHIGWSINASLLEVSIIDIDANFIGLPEYVGPRPGCLVFGDVLSIQVDAASSDRKLRIYDISTRVQNGAQVVEVQFSPSGKLVVHSTKAALVLRSE